MNNFSAMPIGSATLQARCQNKHEDYEAHEAVWAYGGKYLFCSGNPSSMDCATLAKQIYDRAKAAFSLIKPHLPHVLRRVRQLIAQTMRIMRIYKEGLFKGFYLPCIEMGAQTAKKHEADMRQHEAIFILAGGLA